MYVCRYLWSTDIHPTVSLFDFLSEQYIHWMQEVLASPTITVLLFLPSALVVFALHI